MDEFHSKDGDKGIEMSMRSSIYYSTKPETVHVFLDYNDGRVYIDTEAFTFSLDPNRFLSWVKALGRVPTWDVSSVENYIRKMAELKK